MKLRKYCAFGPMAATIAISTSLLAGCAEKGVPEAAAKQCMAVVVNGSVYANYFTLGALTQALADKFGAKIAWKNAPSNGHVLLVKWSDPISSGQHQMGFLLEQIASDPNVAECPGGRQAVTQMQFDDELQSQTTAYEMIDHAVSRWREKLQAAGEDPYRYESEAFQKARLAANAAAAPPETSSLAGAQQRPSCAPGWVAVPNRPQLTCEQIVNGPRTLKSPPYNGELILTGTGRDDWVFSIRAHSDGGDTAEAEGKIAIVDNKATYADDGGCQLSFERSTDIDWHVEQLTPACSGIGVSLTGDYKG